MDYINTSTKARVSLSAIAAEHPDTSFPAQPTDADLAEFGYACLHDSDPPAYDPTTHGVRDATPKKLAGKWTRQWEVYALPADVAGANADAAQRQLDSAAKLAGVDFDGVMCSATGEDQSGVNRIELDLLLAGEAQFKSTVFEFANGNQITLTSANVVRFLSVWRAFRRGFFEPVV